MFASGIRVHAVGKRNIRTGYPIYNGLTRLFNIAGAVGGSFAGIDSAGFCSTELPLLKLVLRIKCSPPAFRQIV